MITFSITTTQLKDQVNHIVQIRCFITSQLFLFQTYFVRTVYWTEKSQPFVIAAIHPLIGIVIAITGHMWRGGDQQPYQNRQFFFFIDFYALPARCHLRRRCGNFHRSFSAHINQPNCTFPTVAHRSSIEVLFNARWNSNAHIIQAIKGNWLAPGRVSSPLLFLRFLNCIR